MHMKESTLNHLRTSFELNRETQADIELDVERMYPSGEDELALIARSDDIKGRFPDLPQQLCDGVELLFPLFPLEEDALASAEVPTVFIQEPEYEATGFKYDDRYGREEGRIVVVGEKMSAFGTGEAVGSWLHFLVNPSLFEQERKWGRKLVRYITDRLLDPKEDADTVRWHSSGYSNILTINQIYCGLHLCKIRGELPDSVEGAYIDSERLASAAERSSTELEFAVRKGASAGRMIYAANLLTAKQLYSQLSTEDYQSFVTMALAEARQMIIDATGSDICDRQYSF